MSAHMIYDLAPLGAIIGYSDGTPRPPSRFRRKLSAWERSNASGRLIGKSAGQPACFTLHTGSFGEDGTVVLIVHRSFDVTSALQFTILECPKAGAVRILHGPAERQELLHLARDRAHAEAWLSRNPWPDAVLQDVTADEVATDVIEGSARP